MYIYTKFKSGQMPQKEMANKEVKEHATQGHASFIGYKNEEIGEDFNPRTRCLNWLSTSPILKLMKHNKHYY